MYYGLSENISKAIVDQFPDFPDPELLAKLNAKLKQWGDSVTIRDDEIHPFAKITSIENGKPTFEIVYTLRAKNGNDWVITKMLNGIWARYPVQPKFAKPVIAVSHVPPGPSQYDLFFCFSDERAKEVKKFIRRIQHDIAQTEKAFQNAQIFLMPS